jgi:hypothetical protein
MRSRHLDEVEARIPSGRRRLIGSPTIVFESTILQRCWRCSRRINLRGGDDELSKLLTGRQDESISQVRFAQTYIRARCSTSPHLNSLVVGASGLGVSHANIPAQRVYENVGFELQANFTNYVEA